MVNKSAQMMVLEQSSTPANLESHIDLIFQAESKVEEPMINKGSEPTSNDLIEMATASSKQTSSDLVEPTYTEPTEAKTEVYEGPRLGVSMPVSYAVTSESPKETEPYVFPAPKKAASTNTGEVSQSALPFMVEETKAYLLQTVHKLSQMSPSDRQKFLELLLEFQINVPNSVSKASDVSTKHTSTLSLDKRELATKTVRELLMHNAISPMGHSWATAIQLLEKRDGSLRLCFGYRYLISTSSTAMPEIKLPEHRGRS